MKIWGRREAKATHKQHLIKSERQIQNLLEKVTIGGLSKTQRRVPIVCLKGTARKI